MKKGHILRFIVFISLSMIMAACSPATFSAAQGSSVDGKALMEAKCSTCHSADRVKNENMTQSEWSNVVLRMVGHGLEVSDVEKEIIITYLADTYK